MANSDNYKQIELLITDNSQKDQSAEEDPSAKFKAQRIKQLQEEGKTQKQIQEQLLKDEEEIKKHQSKRDYDKKLADLKKQIEYGATLQDRLDAENAAKALERRAAIGQAIVDTVSGGLTNAFSDIQAAGKEYADYVERIEVSLLGSAKDYESVTGVLQKVFSMNVFFSLDSAIKKATEAAERGIAYNTELRASMAVMSDKIAKTFDAFDSNLLRLIRIQQEDSTQARLGMENLLLNYLNQNFSDSSYLQGLSDQVSAAILEASSQKSTQDAVQFEYAVQKWLGSMSSVGVSDNTVQALADAIGYLGSGDVQSLTSNSALQQLMALSISKGGGEKSYGDMLLEGVDVEDVSTILTGFYNLVEDISDSGNLVAMNQYAKIFNLSVSDITSTLNISAEQIKNISQDMMSYQQGVSRVVSELSAGNLLDRSSYSQMYNNVKSNIMSAIGMDMANSLAANLAYEAIDQAASIVDMLGFGININPFGVGTSIDIKMGDMLKGATAITTYMAEYLKNIQGLTSMFAPNLSLLGSESSESNTIKLLGGMGTNSVSTNVTKNQATYVGNTESSAVYQSVTDSGKSTASEITGKNIDEEEERMKKTQEAMVEVADHVAFIVQLLNVNGIKVRAMPKTEGDIPAVYSGSSGISTRNFFGTGGY